MRDDLSGKTVGGYDIQAVIGHGGMATVYKARQKSMDREVAIKFLPRQFLSDDTYLQRFEREVQIVSRLEHRNIIPVYDYGEYEGQPYIVMRYMPAGSVDDLLTGDGLPLDMILNIVQQVAAALDYAHQKDVLHRDLKPSNVLLDEAGGAYITDFGIARLQNESGVSITTAGVVGTPSYMSPEQAQGLPLDGRSDVYALGVMLFEMATGRRPFQSDTAYSIAVMHVTTQPPRPRSINPAITTAVESVILRALNKKPESRYGTASVLYEALKLAIERPAAFHDTEPNLKSYAESFSTAKKPAVSPDTSPTAAQSESSPRQAAASPPAQQPVVPAVSSQPYRSPAQSSPVSVYSPRRVDSRAAQSSKPGRHNPVLSMMLGGALGCGLLVALMAVGVVIATGIFSGAPTPTVTPSDIPTLPVLNIRTSITPHSPTPMDETEAVTPVPTDTPDATATALEATAQTARETLIARSLQANDATRTAVALNPPTQPPTATLDATDAAPGVRITPTLEPGAPDINGEIVYAARRSNGERFSFDIMTLNLETGAVTQLTMDDSDNTYPVASPDGRWIAFQSDRDGDSDIYIMNTAGGQRTKLTDNPGTDRLPAWSPDSQWIVYASDIRGDGNYDLYRVRLDGSDNQSVFSNGRRNSHARYSPDGQYLVFTSGSALDATSWEIVLLDLTSLQQVNLTENDQRDASPVFTPDGEQILYVTMTQRDRAIAIMNRDGSEKRVLYDSPGSDWSADYNPDGRYIAFTSSMAGEDNIYLMRANGTDVKLIRSESAVYPSWIPR